MMDFCPNPVAGTVMILGGALPRLNSGLAVIAVVATLSQICAATDKQSYGCSAWLNLGCVHVARLLTSNIMDVLPGLILAVSM
jgi:hypothetical protein